MACRIWRIDPDSTLNRKLAVCCFLSGLYELATALLVAIPDHRWFQACLVLASTIYLAIGPIIISGFIDFAEIKGPGYWILTAPCVAAAALQIAQVWNGSWVIAGFHPTAWGNVSELTTDALPFTINWLSSLSSAAIGFGVLFFAWRNSRSPRYRRIVVQIFVISILVNLWGLFATGIVWLTWGLPDPTGLGIGVGIVGYNLLIERYGHLSERQPDVSSRAFAGPSEAALFVDAQGAIRIVSEEAGRLLGEDLLGKELPKALPGWPSLGEQWAGMAVDLSAREDLPGTIGGGSFRLSLVPHRNPFDLFDGVVVKILPEEELDELGACNGLSAREWEVARLICKGYDTREIAEALFISVATVKSHLHNLYTKTGTSGRADLIRAILSKAPGGN